MVSVVMPAYNVEKYISEAIDSVIAQSYTDWELIIVDDCSTDNTISIVESYVKKYSNIRLIRREVNSGGCRLPRFDGVLVAKGDFVCPIDSDDFIEIDYLQKCVMRQKETMADVVSNMLVFCDDDGTLRNEKIPSCLWDKLKVMSGFDAVKNTIGGWQISVNGLFVNTNLYKGYIASNYNSMYNCGFVDEIDQRKLLLLCNKVAFSDAEYYYRQQPTSIIHDISIKYFNVLSAERLLYDFVRENYKNDSDVMLAVNNSYILQLLICQRLFLERKNRYTKQEQDIVQNKIKEAFLYAKQEKMNTIGLKQTISMVSYPIFLFISYLYVFMLKLKNR